MEQAEITETLQAALFAGNPAAITDDTPLADVFAAMRKEAGWPQPWMAIMYPGCFDRIQARENRRQQQ